MLSILVIKNLPRQKQYQQNKYLYKHYFSITAFIDLKIHRKQLFLLNERKSIFPRCAVLFRSLE